MAKTLKLKAISGSIAGQSRVITQNEIILGRLSSCDWQINAHNMSRRHAQIHLKENKIYLTDLGSANGTFVNGQMIKNTPINPKDKLVIGGINFVLEEGEEQETGKEEKDALSAMVPQGESQIIALADEKELKGAFDKVGTLGESIPKLPKSAKTLQKLNHWLEHGIMRPYYAVASKMDIRVVFSILSFIYFFAIVLLSIIPLSNLNNSAVQTEIQKRGLFMTSQLAKINERGIRLGDANLLETDYFLKIPEIITARIVEQDGKILSPKKEYGTYLESTYQQRGAAIPDSEEYLIEKTLEEGVYVISYPIRILNPKTKVNETKAVAVVVFDPIGEVYSAAEIIQIVWSSFALVGLIGFIVFFLVYKTLTRPLMMMNEEIDLVLKGELEGIENKFKLNELSILTKTVNKALNIAMEATGGKFGVEVTGQNDRQLCAQIASALLDPVCVIESETLAVLEWNDTISNMVGANKNVVIGGKFDDVARDASFIDNVMEAVNEFKNGREDPYKWEKLSIGGKKHHVVMYPMDNKKYFMIIGSKMKPA